MHTEQQAFKRLDYIDIAKGIGIVLVVLGHTIVPQMRESSPLAKALYNSIYSFHMPMFFVLSGIVFWGKVEGYHEKGFKAFAAGKFLSLMVPYFSFSVISYVGIGVASKIPMTAAILNRAGYFARPFGQAVFEILTYQNHMDQHLWFCYALFVIFLLAYLFHRFLGAWYGLVFAFLLRVAAIVVWNMGFEYLSILRSILQNLCFFCLGRLVPVIVRRWMREDSAPVRTGVAMAGLFLLFGLSFIAGQSRLGSSPVLRILANIATALLGTFFFLYLARVLENSRAGSLFRRAGTYSYPIYLMHQPFIVSGGAGLLLAATSLPYFVICAVTFGLGIGLPVFLTKIINKSKILQWVLLGIRQPQRTAG